MESKSSRSEATHERIVDVAARTLRRNGYAGVGVADVMKQAGLTHGGFYAHFPSREALLEEAVERAGHASAEILKRRIETARARGQSPLRALVEHYLSEAHLRGVESGCVVAALGSEMPRQSPGLRASSASRVRNLVAVVQRALPEGGTREQAMVIAATLVGSLQLARTLGAGAPGQAMLAATREAILSQYDRE
ncbi:MAG TPA: TetR/AcrR family transcriptional regulator [Ramlibacter sp.]|jgi:AcrR family transcriptional regulator|nr:TetR/AcrR family transcriptional regulator [Ramlibacter sp.]